MAGLTRCRQKPLSAEMTIHPLVNIPWKTGGRDPRLGLDCVGLALAHLHSIGVNVSVPPTSSLLNSSRPASVLALHPFDRATLTANSLVFFADDSGRPAHVAIYLGGDKFLHTLQGCASRIDRGLTLFRRVGLTPVAQITPEHAQDIAAALSIPGLGWATAILLIISIALSAATAFLTPRPKIGQFRNESGRYGFDQLWTQTNPTIPLPDLFGAVSVAGNCPYQSRVDRSQTPGDPPHQKANKIVILSQGPIEDFQFDSNQIKINGLLHSDPHWHPSGYALNPDQTKAAAVDGTIGSDTHRPSITLYTGAHDISVPVDIRAHYDRNFPVYGFPGCAYLVARLVDSTKYSQWNLIATPKGRLCRTFDASGFIRTTITAEAVGTGDGTTTRFKLDHDDIETISSLTVAGTPFSPISADHQAGNVFHLNRTKGFIEFITPPPPSAAITASYTYFPRSWTRNPARILIYLLTEKINGKGFPEDKIDWEAANALQTHCDELVTWQTHAGTTTEPRYRADYALDYRKPVQDHIRAILDACYSVLIAANGKLVLKPRAAAEPVFAFDTSNILAGSFSAEMMDRSQRANRFHIFYHSLETFSAETEVVRDNPDDQADRAERLGNDGVVEETLRMLAVSTQSQAERLGETMLREDIGSRWIVDFKTTVKGLALQVFDIIEISHPSQPAWTSKKFRIESIEMDENDYLKITASEYVPNAYI